MTAFARVDGPGVFPAMPVWRHTYVCGAHRASSSEHTHTHVRSLLRQALLASLQKGAAGKDGDTEGERVEGERSVGTALAQVLVNQGTSSLTPRPITVLFGCWTLEKGLCC